MHNRYLILARRTKGHDYPPSFLLWPRSKAGVVQVETRLRTSRTHTATSTHAPLAKRPHVARPSTFCTGRLSRDVMGNMATGTEQVETVCKIYQRPQARRNVHRGPGALPALPREVGMCVCQRTQEFKRSTVWDLELFGTPVAGILP